MYESETASPKSTDNKPTAPLGRNASTSSWTPELEARVVALSAQGLTTREIGAMVGLTKNQIVGWLWRNYYTGPTTKDRLEALRDKVDEAFAEYDALAKRGALYIKMGAPLLRLTKRLPKPNGRS